MNRLAINEKLAVNKYILDEGHSHIKMLNEEVCNHECQLKPCLYICPARVYVLVDGKIVIDSAGCLECGACKVVCPNNSLEWNYPRGGFGIIYRGG